jgi:hypothetical protein
VLKEPREQKEQKESRETFSVSSETVAVAYLLG